MSLETIAAVITAIATSVAAGTAWVGYRHVRSHGRPVVDLKLTGFGSADNVVKAELIIRNQARAVIVVKGIRLLKPAFPRDGASENNIPAVGLSSEKTLNQTLLPQKEVHEPFEIEPGSVGHKTFDLFLYERHGKPIEVKLGIDVEYIGTKIRSETIKLKRQISMPQPRS